MDDKLTQTTLTAVATVRFTVATVAVVKVSVVKTRLLNGRLK